MNIDNYDKEEREDGTIVLTPKKKGFDDVPECGDKYWVPTNDGGFYQSFWDNDSVDKEYLAHGNVFPSKAMAEKAAKLQRRANRIIRACLLVDPDFRLIVTGKRLHH